MSVMVNDNTITRFPNYIVNFLLIYIGITMIDWHIKIYIQIIFLWKMFGGPIFFDAIRDAYGKSEQNDKNAWMMDPTWSLLLLFNFFLIQKLTTVSNNMLVIFFLQNLPACALFMLVNFSIKKKLNKSTMIIWDPLSKHFYRFSHFLVSVTYASTICASPYQFTFFIHLKEGGTRCIHPRWESHLTLRL